MSEEEAKALIALRVCNQKDFTEEEWLRITTTIKNLVERQKEEIKKKDKIIDEMANYISNKNYADDICEFRLDVKGRFHKHCYKGECNTCIKQHFESKV